PAGRRTTMARHFTGASPHVRSEDVNLSGASACLTGTTMARDGTVDGKLNCREAIALFGDFLEAALGPSQLAELERHLAGCAPGQASLAPDGRRAGLGGAPARAERPPGLRSRLAVSLPRQLPPGGG